MGPAYLIKPTPQRSRTRSSAHARGIETPSAPAATQLFPPTRRRLKGPTTKCLATFSRYCCVPGDPDECVHRLFHTAVAPSAPASHTRSHPRRDSLVWRHWSGSRQPVRHIRAQPGLESGLQRLAPRTYPRSIAKRAPLTIGRVRLGRPTRSSRPALGHPAGCSVHPTV